MRHALLVAHRSVSGIRARCILRFLCLQRFFCRLTFARRNDLLVAKGDCDSAIVRRVRYNDRRRRIVARRTDRRFVERNQEIALLDLISLFHMRREVLALKIHCIQTDMNEQIDAICRMKSDRMLRRKEYGHFAVKRRDDLTLWVLHRSAAPHRAAAKSRIIDFLECNEISF